MNKKLIRALSMLLTLVMLVGIAPQVFAKNQVYLDEMELPEEITGENVFYMTTGNAQLFEGSGDEYLLRIGRGGDASEAASVNVKIADVTSKYGKDYTVGVLDSSAKVEGVDDSYSLMDMLVGKDYDEIPFKDEEEFYAMTETDEELKEESDKATLDAVEFLEEDSGVDLIADNPEEATAEDNVIPAEEADGSEGLSPMEQTRKLLSGDDAEHQKMTSNGDMMQEIQKVANSITKYIVGANLRVEFAEGESSKYLVIDVDDNMKGDGDRYFYMMLGDSTGSTTVSAAASCALTIVDDEEQEPSQVSIESVEEIESEGVFRATFVREGALNTMASAKLTTTAGTAEAGRDFSPVDMELVFPLGLNKRTVDINYRNVCITEDAAFTLNLSDGNGCDNAKVMQMLEISEDIIQTSTTPVPGRELVSADLNTGTVEENIFEN